MHLTNCKHPRLIRNKYNGESMYVPCGMCSYCRLRYSMQWKSRLVQEFQDNDHAVFFTLTYKDSKVPLAFLDGNEMYSDDWDENLDISDLLKNCDLNTEYLYSRPSFPFAVKRDIQLFLKRVRKDALNKYGTKIRYYIISEYGPKTLRPHYHGILFYDGEDLTSKVRDLISSKWQLGFVDSKFADVSSADYVSSYCSGSVSLPLLYSLKPFKPFVLASRKNPIGFKNYGEVDESKMFFTTSPTYITKDARGEHEEYLPEYYRNKLFPKCVGFNDASRDVRRALYALSCPERCEHAGKCFTSEWTPTNDEEGVLTVCVNGQTFVRTFTNGAYAYSLALSKRVNQFCDRHSISLDEWLDNVELFHNKLEKILLKQQLEFQDNFSRSENCTLSPLIHMYPANLIDNKWFYGLLSNHGFEFISTQRTQFDYEITRDYEMICSVGDKFITDCRRVKSHNDIKSYQRDQSLVGYSSFYFGSS